MDVLLRTLGVFVLGAVFQRPRRAEAQAGVVVELEFYVCDSGLMQLRL